MKTSVKYALMFVGTASINIGSLSANLIFYDSFTEATTPLALPGHTPDTGGVDWADGQNATAVGDTQISAGSLVDPTGLALPTTGGKLSAVTDDDYRGFTSLSDGGLGADDTTIYVSVLIDLTAGGQAATGIEFRRGPTNATTHPANRVFFVGAINASYAAQTQITGASGSAPLVLGQVNFVVARFNFVAGNDTIDVWVNPADAADLAGPADGIISGADFSFDHVATSRFNSTAFGSIDEVRIGTELSDVALPGPSVDLLGLSIQNSSNGTDLEFTWTSQEGKVYDLLSSTDPEADGDPSTWTVVAGQEDIIAEPPTNLLTIQRPADPARFYAIREENAPPSPPLFSDNFESDMGWNTGIGGSHTSNTAWELGAPDINFVDGPDSGANGSATCYGTDLDNNYEAGTEVWLRSPPINLTEATSATLSFWHIFDVNGAGDETAVVRILRSSDNSVLAEVETFDTFDLNLLDWFEFSEALPAAALGETVKLEFLFTVDPGAVSFFPGWHIDEVTVTAE